MDPQGQRQTVETPGQALWCLCLSSLAPTPITVPRHILNKLPDWLPAFQGPIPWPFPQPAPWPGTFPLLGLLKF